MGGRTRVRNRDRTWAQLLIFGAPVLHENITRYPHSVYQAKHTRASPTKPVLISPSIHSASLCWSLSQPSSGEGGGTPWTSQQFITGPQRETNNICNQFPIRLTVMVLDNERKTACPQRTDTRRTCKTHRGFANPLGLLL